MKNFQTTLLKCGYPTTTSPLNMDRPANMMSLINHAPAVKVRIGPMLLNLLLIGLEPRFQEWLALNWQDNPQ